MGGVFALFFILFTICYIIIRLFTEIAGTPAQSNRNRQIQIFIEKYTDAELERQLRAEISGMTLDSENYSVMWNRIVQYEKAGGEMLLIQKENPQYLYIWEQIVGSGNITYDPQGESCGILLELYMNTHNKMCRATADRFLREHYSPTIFPAYKRKHDKQISDYYHWKSQKP